MTSSVFRSSRRLSVLLGAAAVAGVVGLRAASEKSAATDLELRVHPQVFAMMQCWLSDSRYPVVTEVNLDAVEQNGNQFPAGEVTQENGWVVSRTVGGEGFKRYRLTGKGDSRYKVEFQENGGGSLTSSSLLDCSVEPRSLSIDGKVTTVRVLRVHGCSAKAP
jgi:hypothetical protein